MAYIDLRFSNLPAEWELKPLSEVAEIWNTKRAPLNRLERVNKKGIYPYCGANGIVDYIDEYRFDGEYVLIAEDGGYWGQNEQSSYIMRGKFWVNNHAHIISAIDGISDNMFLSSAINYMDISPLIGGDSRGKLTKSILVKLLIPMPPIDEQRRIAHLLKTVQNAVAQQERHIALAGELKRALMHELFAKGLRGEKQKQTEIGLIPQSWSQLQLQKTSEVVYGIQAAVANNLQPVGTKILTNKNITLDGQIVLNDINYFELKTKRHFETILKKGDILFNWRSGSKEHIGKTAFFDLDGEYTHSSFILRIRPNNNIIGRFLFYYLFYLRTSKYFLQKHDVSSVNATFNKSAVDALHVFLPSKNEQEDIVSILDTAANKLELLKRKKNILEELYRTLLHQLMMARTRVNKLEL